MVAQDINNVADFVANDAKGLRAQYCVVLNHVPKDRLIRTYQVGGMAEKLRALFLRWGDFM